MPLPTERVAGELLIELDHTRDWSGVPGVVFSTTGRPFFDYARLPTPSGGSENRIISVDVTDGADQPVRTASATLHMNAEAGSLSSGAINSWINTRTGIFSPVIFGNRMILIQEQIAGEPGSTDHTDYRPYFHGYLDNPEVNYAGDVKLFARDASARLMIPYNGEPFWVGTEGQLVSLPDAIQQILDGTTQPGLWNLHTVGGDLEWAIPAFQVGTVSDILDFIRSSAQQRGAVVRWWYDSVTKRFQLTVFVLQQEKLSPDIVYGAGETTDIISHGSDTTNYRNDLTLYYLPAGAQEPVKIHRPATIGEVTAHGFHPLVIHEASTGHIRDAGSANLMLDSVEAALRAPATIGARKVAKNIEIEVNTLLRFNPDARVTQEPVDLYVTGFTHRKAISGTQVESSTTVQLRGAPVGQIASWIQRVRRHVGAPGAGVELPHPLWEYSLNDFREIGGAPPGWRRFGWQPGSRVAAVWAGYGVYPAPWADDYWLMVRANLSPLPTGQNWIDIPEVPADSIGALRLEPRLSDGSIHHGEVVHQQKLHPIAPHANPWIDARVEAGVINVYAGAEPSFSALPVRWEIRTGSQAGSVIAYGEWRTVEGARDGVSRTTHSALGGLSLSMGRQPFYLRTIDVAGNVQWVSDAVESVRENGLTAAEQFVANLAPIRMVETLPTTGKRMGERVYVFDENNVNANKMFEWTGVWTETEPSVGDYSYLPVIIAAAIRTQHLAADSVTADKLAAITMAVEKYLRSINYDRDARTGFILNGDGSAFFGGDVEIAGTLLGADGTFRGIVTVDTAGLENSLNFEHQGDPVGGVRTLAGTVRLHVDGGSQIDLSEHLIIQTANQLFLISGGSVAASGGIVIGNTTDEVAWFGGAPKAKLAVTGSTADEKIDSVIEQLASYNLITDSTT